MNCRWLVWVGLLLLAFPAWSQTPAERVETVRKLVTDSKFKEAATELETLGKQDHNPREVVIAFYELSGLTQAGLKKDPKAKQAFQKLLTLEPTFKLAGKVPPKTAAIFKSAKQAVTQAGGGGLKSEQLTPELKGGLVTSVYASVENDLTQLAKIVRWHLRIDGGAWTVKEVPVQGMSNVEAGGKYVQWWLEVLGESNAVLFTLGSEAQPNFDAVPGATAPKADAKKVETAKSDVKKDAPVADAKPKLVPDQKVETGPEVAAAPGKPLPIVPIALGGAGVVSVGVGIAFGAMSSSARNQLEDAKNDPATGIVRTMTRAEAVELNQKAQTDAVVANTLVGVGVGLVVGGVVAYFLGGK
jgi:hypothetical protein